MSKDRSKDRELWEKVKRTAKPLHSNRAAITERPAKKITDSPPETAALRKPARIIKPFREEPPVSISSGIKQKLLDEPTRRKISKGRLEIEARIDLHGMTQNEAFDRLSRFLQHAYDSGRRTVLVITGKGSRGEGVLKSAVPRWLEEPHFRKITTGYHEASISHGGSGALYIRLRRKRAI